jgi:hypothetical protein
VTCASGDEGLLCLELDQMHLFGCDGSTWSDLTTP